VPDQGAQQVVELHSRLYGGALMWAHRADVPYVPHITVAAMAEFSQCEALAAELAREEHARSGRVESLTVVEISGATVRTRTVSRLAGRVSGLA
jgi:hypothetical protein